MIISLYSSRLGECWISTTLPGGLQRRVESLWCFARSFYSQAVRIRWPDRSTLKQMVVSCFRDEIHIEIKLEKDFCLCTFEWCAHTQLRSTGQVLVSELLVLTQICRTTVDWVLPSHGGAAWQPARGELLIQCNEEALAVYDFWPKPICCDQILFEWWWISEQQSYWRGM